MGECIKPLSPFRKARRHVAACAVGLAWASFAAIAQVAQVSNDRVIVIGGDGRAYLVRQRLATDGPLVSADLPGEAAPPSIDLDPDANPDSDRDAEPATDANDDVDARAGSREPAAIDLDADGVPDERDVCVGMDAAYRTTTTAAMAAGAGGPIPGCDARERVILGDVQFRSGSSYLEFDARRRLDRVAAALASLPGSRWNIAAYTDDEGSARWNRTLSMRRADAVRRYLMLRGLGPNQVSASGHGENAPIADNAGEAGRKRNRRIELHRLAP